MHKPTMECVSVYKNLDCRMSPTKRLRPTSAVAFGPSVDIYVHQEATDEVSE
jgi:hypothetical protein